MSCINELWQSLSPKKIAVDCPWTSALLLVLGSVSLGQFLLKTIYAFVQTFLLSGTSLKKFGAKKGAWAVVTGASDGIGREYALQLAKAGFNILLVARNQQMLSTLAEEIGTKYGPSVTAKVQLIDFAQNNEAAFQSLANVIESLDVGVLVNNVGKSHEMPVDFIDTPPSEIADILTINITGTLRLTSIVLPIMKRRRAGLILNMGSFAGAVPSPMLATYSASKAFLATFTAALAPEVAPYGIAVQHLNTFYVVSKMSKLRKPSPLVPLPSTYVRSVLGKVGLSCGAAFTGRPATATPFWSHAVADWLIGSVGWVGLFVGYTHRLHKDIRKRALRKKERDAKKA
ncbi:hypothetical protein HWV62_21154 [Athelia sp. TMB]|nr:hypothetical protein HWV62_21154 [Athelia sp. TMB]